MTVRLTVVDGFAAGETRPPQAPDSMDKGPSIRTQKTPVRSLPDRYTIVMLKIALIAILAAPAGAAVQEVKLPAAAPLAAPQAMLFDWDGTIVDEGAVWHAVLAETAIKLELPVPPREESEKAWVLERPAFFERYFPGKDRDLVRNTFVELMTQAHAGAEMNGQRFDGVKILPGAVDVLDAVKARGIPMALVSNKSQVQLDAEVKETGLGRYFAHVQGFRKGSEYKPSPKPISEAANAIGIAPEKTWYVGNEPTDIEASIKSGARPVLVEQRWKAAVTERHAEQDASGHIIYVDGPAGLKPIVESLPKAKARRLR